MSVISVFCKKGGVGKTTFIGYLGHYYAKQGKKVLILSADDQNSIFKLFSKEDIVFDSYDNYFEHYIAGKAELGDILIEVRENLYLIKTLNTDKLSMKLTNERSTEKIIKNMFKEYSTFFDYILIDFPPSSSRLTEVLIDFSDVICIVVGLDELGLGGYWNTIQYFVDSDLDIEKIKYVIPNGFSNNRRAPKLSLETLKEMISELSPNAKLLDPIAERSIIKNIQAQGVSVYDDTKLSNYDQGLKDQLEKDLSKIFDEMEF